MVVAAEGGGPDEVGEGHDDEEGDATKDEKTTTLATTQSQSAKIINDANGGNEKDPEA